MNNDFSVRKKLELMQQIRSRYQRDKYDMFHREKILYGRTSAPRDNTAPGNDPDDAPAFSTLPLRLFLAAAALALIVLSDRTGSNIFGLSAKQCFQAISEDYESSIATWADAASRAILNNKTKIEDKAIINDKNNSDGPLEGNPPAGSRP